MKQERQARYEIGSLTLNELLERNIKQPRFAGKRGYAWSAAQKREYLRNCMEGHYPGTVMLVKNSKNEDSYYLLDFTQRYLALKEHMESPAKNFKTKEETSVILTAFLARTFPEGDIVKIAEGTQYILEHCREMDSFTLLQKAIKTLSIEAGGANINANEFESIIDSYMPEVEDLGNMSISSIIFDSMDDAVFNYIQMNTNQHNLSNADIWRARWNNCEIDITSCSYREEIIEALDRYYQDIRAKMLWEQEDWETKRARIKAGNDDAAVYERILDESSDDLIEIARNFEYNSSSISEDGEGRLYISLYELCCALAYMFYKDHPQFAIPKSTRVNKHEWKASYLGFIFLADVFDISHKMSSGVEKLAEITPSLNDVDFLAKLIASIKEETDAFVDAYDKALFFIDCTPSEHVFADFIDLAFYCLWHANHKLVKNPGAYSLVGGNPQTYEKVKRVFPVLLFKTIMSAFAGISFTRARGITPRASYVRDFELFFKEMEEWEWVEEALETLRKSSEDGMASYRRYNAADYNVLYSMFSSIVLGNKVRDDFEKGTIFDIQLVNDAIASTGQRRREGSIDFGNIFYMPKIKGLKSTTSLYAQRKLIDDSGFGDVLSFEELEQLFYPKDPKIAQNKRETFESIRSNLLKDRPKMYLDFIKNRQEHILEVLSLKMEEIAKENETETPNPPLTEKCGEQAVNRLLHFREHER